MTIRSALLALAIVLAPAASAQAAATTPDQADRPVPRNELAPVRPGGPSVGLVDPAALDAQLRARARGMPHDARRFLRLMALVRDPGLSLAVVSQYANLGGGAGMGLGTDVAAPPPQRRVSRPPGMGPQPMEAPQVTTARPAPPMVRAISVATVVGDDPGAIDAFVQALGASDRQVLLLQDQLGASLLLGDYLTPGNVVAVDRVASSGELEVYTIP